jgi:polyphosphate kinase 2 (PPK2 family)
MSAARDISKPYRVEDGSKFRLKDFDPDDTSGVNSKEHAEEILANGVQHLAALQDKLYAQDRWAVLIILQGMDAAGKDGVIKHVMAGINPQGCEVFSFKQPSVEPEKNWKFSAADIAERAYWNDYMNAYQDAIQHTATPHAPWYVVPADHKWYTRLVVAAAVVHALEKLNLSYPKVDAVKRKELAAAREALEHEGDD